MEYLLSLTLFLSGDAGAGVSTSVTTQVVSSREGCYMSAKAWVGNNASNVGERWFSTANIELSKYTRQVHREAICTKIGFE